MSDCKGIALSLFKKNYEQIALSLFRSQKNERFAKKTDEQISNTEIDQQSTAFLLAQGWAQRSFPFRTFRSFLFF